MDDVVPKRSIFFCFDYACKLRAKYRQHVRTRVEQPKKDDAKGKDEMSTSKIMTTLRPKPRKLYRSAHRRLHCAPVKQVCGRSIDVVSCIQRKINLQNNQKKDQPHNIFTFHHHPTSTINPKSKNKLRPLFAKKIYIYI